MPSLQVSQRNLHIQVRFVSNYSAPRQSAKKCASARKKPTSEPYPKGYAQLLEKQQSQLTTGLLKLYKVLQNVDGQQRELAEFPRPVLVHEILAALNMLDPECRIELLDEESFEEETEPTKRQELFSSEDVKSSIVGQDGSITIANEAIVAPDCLQQEATKKEAAPSQTRRPQETNTAATAQSRVENMDTFQSVYNKNEESYPDSSQSNYMSTAEWEDWTDTFFKDDLLDLSNTVALLLPAAERDTGLNCFWDTFEQRDMVSMYYPWEEDI
ncbi:unnamed protein product [Aureobasidium pullulans]|nr:unnamed protein product [Aureobasidium pullulans]